MQIEINGKSYELHFGMKAFMIAVGDTVAVDAEEYLTTDLMTNVVWGGMVNAAFRQKKSLPASLFAEVADFVEQGVYDEERKSLLNEIYGAFEASQPVQHFTKKAEQSQAEQAEEKKSDLTSTNS